MTPKAALVLARILPIRDAKFIWLRIRTMRACRPAEN